MTACGVRYGISLVGAVSTLALWPSGAAAHLEVTSHTTRFDSSTLKDGPCGALGAQTPRQVYEFERGQSLQISWDEFIDHPGHYRISFDASGADSFVDPTSADDLYPDATVLLDDIADVDGQSAYQATVTLPDVLCETCSLQVMQVMTDKPPFGDGDDLYYQCIDVRLVAVGTASGGASSGGNSGSGGGSATGASAGSGDDAGVAGADGDDGSSGCSVARTRASGGFTGGAALVSLFWLLARGRRTGAPNA